MFVAHHPADAHGGDTHAVAPRVERAELFGPELGERIEIARLSHRGIEAVARLAGSRDLHRAGEHDPAHAVLARGFEHVMDPEQVRARQRLNRRVIRLGGEVHDGRHPGDRPAHRVRVGDVADDGVGELRGGNAVEPAHDMAPPHELLPHGAPDGASRACHEHAVHRMR